MGNKEFHKQLKKITRKITVFCSFIILISVVFLLINFGVFNKESLINEDNYFDQFTINSQVAMLDDSSSNLTIKYGFELFKKTSKYIGPDNGDPNMAYSGNNLSCNNCHLHVGTKPYSGPLIGVIDRFPQYRGRENKMGTIEERINGCMERSMNGRILPPDGKEMQAFISYLDWLGQFAEEKGRFKSRGFAPINIPERAVDMEHGKMIFDNICAVCHGKNGEGVQFKDSPVYQYPPLWGDDSFNNGAGMNRVITAAEFIKYNMPYGATFDEPILTDEQAYDVSGYINQQQRPAKPNLEIDFPDLIKKPISTPYPPYVDDFSIEQHQLGPFQPIIDFYKLKYGVIKTK